MDTQKYFDLIKKGGYFDIEDVRGRINKQCAVELNDRFQVLYEVGHGYGHISNDLNFKGLLDKKNDLLYLDYKFGYISDFQLDERYVKSFNDVSNEILDKVCDKITEHFEGLPTGPITHYDVFNAEKLIIKDEELEKNTYYLSDSDFKVDSVIKYLNEPDKMVNDFVNDRIKNKEVSLKGAYDYWYNEKIMYDQLKQNISTPLQMKKDLYKAMDEKKTVQVNYEAANEYGIMKNISFPINTNQFKAMITSCYGITSNVISNSNSQKLYKEVFGDSYINFDGIKSVSFRRNMIYNKEDYKQYTIDELIDKAGCRDNQKIVFDKLGIDLNNTVDRDMFDRYTVKVFFDLKDTDKMIEISSPDIVNENSINPDCMVVGNHHIIVPDYCVKNLRLSEQDFNKYVNEIKLELEQGISLDDKLNFVNSKIKTDNEKSVSTDIEK